MKDKIDIFLKENGWSNIGVYMTFGKKGLPKQITVSDILEAYHKELSHEKSTKQD